jgi:hypothetical protein
LPAGHPHIVAATADATYTAQWTLNTYQITFDANGGEGGTILTVDHGTVPEPPAVSRDGYTFAGWTPDIVAATEDATYTAFGTKSLPIKSPLMPTGVRACETLMVNEGTVPVPPTVTKEGYSFVGWTPDLVEATEDTIYTAQWTVNTYNAFFMFEGEVYATVPTVFGAIVIPPMPPDKTGHTFSDWQNYPPSMPANVVFITAVFTVNTYVAYFMIDGMNYQSLSFLFGDPIVLPDDPEKEGHTFEGWDIVPDTMLLTILLSMPCLQR